MPNRCPHCQALVVDRRSAVCTTCKIALPPEWVMVPEQAAKLKALDREIRSQHAESMSALDPIRIPDGPPIVKILGARFDSP